MQFNSYQFLLFFPVVVLVFYLIPKRVRYIWLLVASYYYYMCWNAKYAVLMAFSTLVTYASGLVLERIGQSDKPEQWKIPRKKWVVAGSFLLNLGLLFFFKYAAWLTASLGSLLGQPLTLPFNIILPVGISFYTFQALSYTMDIYKGEIPAEKNLLRYALFVSFFPQLVAGPIERSKNLLKQLDFEAPFQYDNVVKGLQLMLFGFFEKIVIADHAALVVDRIYNNPGEAYGAKILFATILFALQLYCDFGGYSHIAIGAAKILNVELMQNFAQPYFAVSIQDFWHRWHISLSTWFRDYLYIPLGGSRLSRGRKYFNIMATFLVSGLWHGAGWHYVIWGGIHGMYQVLGDALSGVRTRLKSRLHIRTDCFSYRLFQRIITFGLVDFALLFFRAENMQQAFAMLRIMVTNFNLSGLLSGGLYSCGLTDVQLRWMLLSALILLVVDMIHEKGISISAFLEKQNLLFRWSIYYGAVFLIIIGFLQTFGISAANFIYFQF